MQRLRVRHAKRGRLRFTSHRDFQRAFERALRRAGVPIAQSAGFSPHPRVSYAGAAPTGVASEAEYLELLVTQRLEPDAVREALDAALPSGLDVLEVVEARPGAGALADRLEASVWEIRLPGVDDGTATAAVSQFLGAQRVEVQRRTKNGLRTFDARAAVLSLGVASRPDEEPCAILTLVVRNQTHAVRPDDVLSGLQAVAGLAPPTPPVVTRLAQGPLREHGGTVADPLAPDRDIAGATEQVSARP